MSKGSNPNGLYVDTGLLRDHVSALRKQKKLATRLYENVAVMKTLADPADADRYNPILRDIEQMIEYFDRMANQLTIVHDEAVQLSHELRGMIKDSTQLTKHIIAEQLVI